MLKTIYSGLSAIICQRRKNSALTILAK